MRSPRPVATRRQSDWRPPRRWSSQLARTWCAGRPGGSSCRRWYQVPAWFGPPGGLADLPAEGVYAPVDLRVGHERGQVGGQVTGERRVEFVSVQEQEPVLGREDRRLRRVLRETGSGSLSLSVMADQASGVGATSLGARGARRDVGSRLAPRCRCFRFADDVMPPRLSI